MAATRALIRARGAALVSVLALTGCRGSSEDTTGSSQAGPQHDPQVTAAIARGHELFFGKAMCATCHRVQDEGTMIVGPNLGVGDDMSAPVAARVASRGVGLDPPIYVVDSILDPNAIVVPGYARSVMKSPDDIPVELSDDEIVALAAFVLSVGAREPIQAQTLARARSHIPKARAAREARRAAE